MFIATYHKRFSEQETDEDQILLGLFDDLELAKTEMVAVLSKLYTIEERLCEPYDYNGARVHDFQVWLGYLGEVETSIGGQIVEAPVNKILDIEIF